MRAKSYLKLTRNLDKDIKAIQDTLTKLRSDEMRCTSVLSDMPRGGGSSDRTSITDKRIDLENKLRQDQIKHYCMIQKATDMIDVLKEPEKRAILRQYYINGHTWEETAVLVGYGWSRMHELHKEALAEIETSYKSG